MSSKDGRGVQIRTEVTNHMLASRQKQSDFVDFFDLSDENNDEAVYPLWTSRENTEEFRRQYYEMHRIATASQRDNPGTSGFATPMPGLLRRAIPETFGAKSILHTMAVTSTQSRAPKSHLREGANYSDSSNDIIRLLSIRGNYRVHAYIVLGNPRSEMHSSVTGLTGRNAFEDGFIFVDECVEDWNSNQPKSSDSCFVTGVPRAVLSANS
jgi:hypothetical protein